MHVVIFAAVMTLAQIHTGKDLLDACTATDTAVCDTKLKNDQDFADCMLLLKPGETPRQVVVNFLRKNPEYLTKPAGDAISAALGFGCE